MKLKSIDNGNNFDWSMASSDYAKYRDIYPKEMYQMLNCFGVGKKGQKILDIGTGTGVIPRNMYACGYDGDFYGIDIADGQIAMAKELSKSSNMDISYKVCSAEKLDFDNDSFDTVIAVQCWSYLDKSKVIPEIKRVLKPDGELIVAFMSWLPEENEIVKKSFDIVHEFNPSWNGYDHRTEVTVPKWVEGNFRMTTFHAFDADVPFTSQSWNGRMKASRGVGATLSPKEVEAFSKKHLKMIENDFGKEFNIKHEIVIMKFKNIR